MMIPVVHRSGCGGVAFYLTRPVQRGDILGGGLMVWPDGRLFQEDDGTGQMGDLIVCAVCRLEVATQDFLDANGSEGDGERAAVAQK